MTIEKLESLIIARQKKLEKELLEQEEKAKIRNEKAINLFNGIKEEIKLDIKLGMMLNEANIKIPSSKENSFITSKSCHCFGFYETDNQLETNNQLNNNNQLEPKLGIKNDGAWGLWSLEYNPETDSIVMLVNENTKDRIAADWKNIEYFHAKFTTFHINFHKWLDNYFSYL